MLNKFKDHDYLPWKRGITLRWLKPNILKLSPTIDGRVRNPVCTARERRRVGEVYKW